MVNLKKLLPKKEEEEEYFWSLLIEHSWVQSGIWKIENGKAKVIITSPPSPWNVDEELISSADTALSSAIQSFPENLSEPSKTVFAVSSGWVEEGQIKEDYLEKIKKLCSELSLTPIGFVVLPEALAHYKKSDEGTPLSAVELGIYKDNLEISIFSMGNLLGTSQVSRSVSLEEDVTEGLSRFSSAESIPSRFLLYDGKEGELEDARQLLLKINWEDFPTLKILHTPKIEIIDVKTKVYAVCLSGASELAGVTSLEISDVFASESKVSEEVPNLKETPLDLKEKTGLVIEGESEEIDVMKENEIDEGSDSESEDELNEKTPESLGFTVEKDISQNTGDVINDDNFTDNIDKYHENVIEVEERLPIKKDAKAGFRQRIDGYKKSFFSNLPKFQFPKGAHFSIGKKIFLSGFLFILLLSLLGFAAWWFLPKATVTIYLSPQNFGESVDLSVDSKLNSSDIQQGILAGTVQKVSVNGEKTKDTTGVKTVGEKAVGEVTLYRVGPELSLQENTLINGPEGLKFALDSNVVVASGSASTPGKTNAKVTAVAIGSEFNLAGGTSFSVANYSTSDIEAINESSFSGGSSRDVSSVSKNDIEVIEADLLEELSGQAKNQLKESLSKDKYFVENSLVTSTISKNLSAKEGDEAKSLKLSMEVEAKAVLLEKKDLIEFAKRFLSEKIPEGYVLRDDQINFNFDYINEKEGLYKFKVRVSANLLPQLDETTIKGRIKGRRVNIAEDFLTKEVSGFIKAEIRIWPTLPDKIKTLPHIEKRIEISFAAEK